VLLLVVVAIGAFSALFNWQGVCDQADGTQVPCSRLDFALGEMFWATFLFIPFFFIATLVYLGMSLAQFIAAKPWKRRDRGFSKKTE
jgi:hypothetical protein